MITHKLKHAVKNMKNMKDIKNVIDERVCSYSIHLKSSHLPFILKGRGFKQFEHAENQLQEFIKLIEKKFDTIWYIGMDYLSNNLYERFMFHHGGFMEISLTGEIKCFFFDDRSEKMKKAIFYAMKKMSNERMARVVVNEIKTGKRLISLKDSVLKE